MHLPALRRLPVPLLLATILAACGTTVPVSSQAEVGSAGGGLGTGLSDTSGTGQGAAGGSTGGSGGGASGQVAGGSASGSTVGSEAGSASGTAGSTGGGSTGALGTGGGTSAVLKPIQVGITYVKDAAAGFQAVGIQGGTLGDMHLYAQKLVDDANSHGGLGGRKIVPVYFAYDVNPGTPSYDQQDTSACAQLTQDNHVEVAIVTFAGFVLDECLQKRHIPMLLDGPGGGFSSSVFKHFSEMVCLGCFNLDRRAAQQVPALVRQKYFSAWDSTQGAPGKAPVKIGVVTYDYPGYPDSVNGPLTKALVSAGYPKPDVVLVSPHDSYDDLGKMQSQLANAVLKFRAEGVTHVLVWDDNGVATLFFMQNAESQKYRPRYGINSGNNMQTVAKAASANQLKGAIGIGWDPSFDIADAKSPTSRYSNSARRKCYSFMKKDGVATGAGFNETSAMLYCSTIWALKDRWEHMAHPTPAGLVASVEAFGTSFVDPGVSATWFSPTQHDGNSGIYDYLYDTSCSCMAYRGGLHLLPHG